MATKFKLVREDSDFIDGKVWVLRHPSGYYKQIGFGERAEFQTKKEAQKYLDEVNESYSKPLFLEKR